jgi:class 3 adenylate cyclase/pimeloyl-ACP methyl ester carboxylesterase
MLLCGPPPERPSTVELDAADPSRDSWRSLGSVVVVEMAETRYAQSGDLSIAYQSAGSGPPDILFVPGFVSNVELMWDVPWINRALERLASLGRVVFFDKRGTGLSDRTLGSGSAEERMDDLRAVADAADVHDAVLVGLSEGGPLAILFATTYPERVRTLVLWGTFARLLRGPDYPSVMTAETADAFIETVVSQWGTGRALRNFVGHLPDDPSTDRATARYERQTATPRIAREILFHNTRMDVRTALSAIQVPTLVVHRIDDPLVAIENGRAMAGAISGARLVELPGDWHVNGQVGGEDDVFDSIGDFISGDESRTKQPVDRVLATVLFTDIVDSTSRASSAGDRSWRALLERHDDAARREIEHFGGRFVTRTGDGLLATFDGPGRAVRAAQTIVDTVKPLGLEVRAGLHTGEIERRNGDVAGIGVHIGSRICSLAGPNEVLVSNTVKDLVMGSELEFADRSVHNLKGVPGSWQLWAAV